MGDAEAEAIRLRIMEVIALHDKRYDVKFEAQDRAVSAALASAEKAVSKAEASTERRFENVNEFRQTLSDQAKTFMPRSEAIAALDALEVRQRLMEKKMDTLEGRTTGSGSVVAYIIAGIGILIAVASVTISLLK